MTVLLQTLGRRLRAARLARTDRRLAALTGWVPTARDAGWHRAVDVELARRGRLAARP